MLDEAIWEVDINVNGPITVPRPIKLDRIKSSRGEDPFYSEIRIRKTDTGIKAQITARATSRNLARRAAVLFFGRALDVLCLQINQPLWLNLTNTSSLKPADRHSERRRVPIGDWENAFDEAWRLNREKPDYLRGLSWYRKGLTTEDAFDRFLAFWNSIEIVASKYHPKVPQAQKGSKSQIWESFKSIWGECKDWPVIPGDESWIDDAYEIRVDIAHGAAPINIRSVERVSLKLDSLKILAYKFLVEYRSTVMSL